MIDSNRGSISGVPTDVLPKNLSALICVSLGLIAACPLPASAAPGSYAVEVCTPSSDTGGGGPPTRLPSGGFEGSGTLYRQEDAQGLILEHCAGGNVVMTNPLGVGLPGNARQEWDLVAPEGSRIERLGLRVSMRRSPLVVPSGSFPSRVLWEAAAGPNGERVLGAEGNLLAFRETGQAFFPEEFFRGTAEVGSRVAVLKTRCIQESAQCGLGSFTITQSQVSARVDDEFLPGVSGPVLPGSRLRGAVDVGFGASDKGSGIAEAELVELNGDQKTTLASISDDNGGKCTPTTTTPVPTFKYMQPCKLELESSFPLDTTTLAEGQHTLAILVTDASGLQRETAPLTVLVHNAPSNAARPTIQGEPHPGSTLTATAGDWVGSPTSIAFQWFRCPPSVQGEEGVRACGAIAGASGSRYVPGKADLGQRDLVEVKASNAFGTETRLSFPTDVIETAAPRGPVKPQLSHVKLSRKRFRVGTTLSKGRHGAVLAFTTNRKGEVSIAIRRPRRHGKPKSLGKLVAPVKAGRNRVLISGQIGKRRLRPGPYEALVRVTDRRGTASDPARVRFRIIKG